MNENPTIQDEIAQLGEAKIPTTLRIPAPVRYRIIQFAVENGIDDAPYGGDSAEAIAISIILGRYFRMVDSEKFNQFF
jgi:hypothetical protein